MAENINLGTFDFDTTRLEASLNKLQSDFFALKKEQEGYKNQSDATKKTILELTKAQLALAASGEETSDAFKENEEAISDLNKVEEQLFKNQQNVGNQMARVRGEINQTNKQLQSYMSSTGEFNTLQEAANKALTAEIKNKNDAKAANIELNRVSNQLNPSIKEEAELLKLVNAQIDKNTEYIKENSSESAKQKMNVGNYAQSIKDALGELGGFNGALGNTEQALSKLTPLFGGLKNQAQAAFDQIRTGTTATEGFTVAENIAAGATNIFSGALKLLKVALISTGIGAIVVLLGSLVAYFSSTQAGADKLSSALQPLKAVFSAIMGIVTELGGKLVEAFSNPKKALSDLGNFLKQNLINRFTALGEILEGIVTLDFTKVLNGAAQAATGVEDLTGKISNAASEAGKFLDENIKKGQEIDKINKQIAKSTLEYNAAQVAVGDQLDANNLIIKDTSKTFAERAKAAEENIAITEKNGQAEKAILELELRRLKLQQQIKGIKNLTNEDRQEEIDLLAKIDEAEDRGLNARLENSRVLAGLQKERREADKKASDEEIKQIQERMKVAIDAMNAELDFYIASQGTRKKSMQDQLNVDREVMNQKIEIARAQADLEIKQAQTTIKNVEDRNKAIAVINRQFDVAELEAQNEFMAQQSEAAITNADMELERFLMNNQRKVEANKYFNDELLQQELDRLNRVSEAEAANATARLVAGELNAEEYALAIQAIDDKYRTDAEAATQEREDAKKEKAAADLAIQDQINAERFEYDLQLSLERNQIQYEQDKAQAIANGADMIAFEQAQAEKKKQIERAVTDNKLQLAATTFGTIADILGKESAAGKAAGVAQTTVETYRGATAAFTGMTEAIPGPVGIALGVVAAAGAVAAGLANVKKILAVKPATVQGGVKRPSYASGGLITGAGTGTSDNVDISASNGESIMTARATAMFPTLLSDINQAGGGVRFDGNSTNTLLQNSINQRADSSQMVDTIAEAVRVGSAQGTAIGAQKGIGDLSDNRQIMADAKF